MNKKEKLIKKIATLQKELDEIIHKEQYEKIKALREENDTRLYYAKKENQK